MSQELFPFSTQQIATRDLEDSSTSQLESIRFKYLRLKKHLKELRTCPECKNRYAKHTCIKALSHGAIFLATCNAILLLVDVKLANTRFHPTVC